MRGAMPAGSQRDEVTRALEQSEQQFRIAEAQIANGLGYALCECQFPPTPMLKVGWLNGRGSPPTLVAPLSVPPVRNHR